MSRARFRPRALRLAPLLAAFLLSGAAQQPDDLIRVKGIGADTTVAVVASDAGALVRLDVMARLLGGGLDSAGVGVWRFTIYGTSLDVFEGLPFVGYNGFVLPVSEPTRVVQGAPHVSLPHFSDIRPRFGIGVLWDRTRSEVQLFQSIARVPASAPARTPAPATTPVLPTAAPAAPNGGETSGTRTAPAGPPRLPNGLTRRYTVAVDAGHGGPWRFRSR
jgi:hypothetical protein